MTVLLPTSVDEAVAALATPGAQALAGGTDFMVEVNARHRPVDVVVSLSHITALRTWERTTHGVTIGAGVTYTQMLESDLAALVPALAQAARTVGSPQIRNAGTLGGNLGTASPAGDTLPVLAALDAIVDIAGPAGRREVAFDGFVTGPKRNVLEPSEIVVAVRLPVITNGSQEYRKVGVRNAMVIAVASLALVFDADRKTVACGLGSVGPVPARARAAEAFAASRIDWDHLTVDRPDDVGRFAGLVADASSPIDDHRSTAEYRRHAVRVLAARALTAAAR